MIRVLEITWMVIAIVSLLTGLYITFTRSLEDSYVFLLIAGASMIFFWLRRRQRIDSENNR
jgi:hypothetical protein